VPFLLDDVCSDLSAIHGIRDATRLGSAQFFTVAVRLPYYRGAVAARIAALAAEDDAAPGMPPRPGRPAAAPAPGSHDDIRARFAAAQSMPVATAGELAAITARASLPGQPAGSVVQVPASQ
jgi:hypothetical protein